MHCEKCGQLLPEGVKFCDKCGSQQQSYVMSPVTQTQSEDQKRTEPKYAGFWIRFVASVIDSILIWIILFVFLIFAGIIIAVVNPNFNFNESNPLISILYLTSPQ